MRECEGVGKRVYFCHPSPISPSSPTKLDWWPTQGQKTSNQPWRLTTVDQCIGKPYKNLEDAVLTLSRYLEPCPAQVGTLVSTPVVTV